jgi:hypothetical protein
LATRFRTIISHNGIFSTYGMMGFDIPAAFAPNFAGQLWEDGKAWDDWDPARFTQNWKTPMLVTHSDGERLQNPQSPKVWRRPMSARDKGSRLD